MQISYQESTTRNAEKNCTTLTLRQESLRVYMMERISKFLMRMLTINTQVSVRE